MRKEKVVGRVGLGLFCLFPLLGLLQMRDPDDLWRQVAERSRASVVALYAPEASGESERFACGVLLQSEPRLVAVTGRCRGRALRSRFESTWVDWRVLLESPDGDFAVLEETAAPAAAHAAALVPGDGRAAALPDAEGEAAASHEAVLVAPEVTEPQPVYIGTLQRGPRGYVAAELRPVGGEDAVTLRLDPRLEGAPFVDADGTLVALYGGMSEGRPVAIPLQRILTALELLGRQVRS